MRQPTLTIEQFFERFKPITNPHTTDADFENRLFGIRGKEQEAVYKTDIYLVWTLLDSDGERFVVPGRYFVNREGYFIATLAYDGPFMEIPVWE